nr:hypothetical protein [Tanacetum cinerariifolium]
MENPNHLNEPNEAIPEVNPVVPELNQVTDIHDPNEMVDIPDDIDLVDYEEEDPEEDLEEEPEEDVDIELEDDVELIFPYEVEGDKTSPPGDVSFDSGSSESELEDEEIDVAPEATVGTINQKPYAICDFPRGLFEVGESSFARDSSNVDGLAPWTLRRDLEALHTRARVMEAELGTCQTEIALLKSKDKIREKERELLNHDLEIVERALGNVLERVSVLESGENATLKKRLLRLRLSWCGLVWSVILLRGGCMSPEIMPPKAMSEARMREIIRDQVTTSMAEFMANMNRGTGGAGAGGAGADGAGAGGAGVGGARPAVPEITKCTYITFIKCEPHPFKSIKGAVGLCQWFEKLEFMFDKVKFATATLQGHALTWWNERIASMGIDVANGTSWTEVRKWMTGSGYSRKKQKQGKKRQNQTQNEKDRKRQSHLKPKVKSQSLRSTKVNLEKVKVNPGKVKVNPDKAEVEKRRKYNLRDQRCQTLKDVLL